MANNSKIAAKLSSPLALLLMAAVLAGGVAWLAYYYLQQREETMKQELAVKSQKKATPKVSVVVPKIDAGVNTVLNENNFVARKIEEDLVYPDTLLAANFNAMIGQKLARPVLSGRPVRLTDLQLPEVNDVSTILPQGTRAMTIDIDNLNSIAQTLRPNHHVDIFLLSKAPKPSNPGEEVDEKSLEQVSLFMQDMVVLATGKEFQDVSTAPDQSAKMVRPGEVEGAREKGFDSITLLVKPEEAARLLVGQKMGTYRVVLRGNKDRDALAMKPVRAGDINPSAKSKLSRDAGIEFIVGGRGDKIVSQLPVTPTQQALAGFTPKPVPQSTPNNRASGDVQTEDIKKAMGIISSAANQAVSVSRSDN